jgi:hypothetical protein
MLIAVAILLNQTHPFCCYQPGDELRAAWHGQAEYEQESVSDDEVLDDMYRIFNINHPPQYKARSLSVGDVIVLGGDRLYAVESFGFKRLAQPQTLNVRESREASWV